MQCVNKNTREYQTLLKQSGLSDLILSAQVGRFLEKLGRYPYLDELLGANSETAIKEDLHLKDNVTDSKNILEATNSESIEQAIPKLNDKYRDKEIEVLELGETSKVYIIGRPDTLLDPSELLKNEMLVIKTKAIANGTFMLAPNGKKSNLTEKQWLQVRTKAFKKWFGDWEKVVSSVNLDEVSHTGTGRTHYYEYKINNNEGYVSIAVDTKNKTISITGIEAVKGKGLGVNSYIALQNKFSDFTINSDEDALSVDAEKMWDRMVTNGIAIKNSDKNYTLKLPNVSKVVDENGEPLVVYHTNDMDFDTFDLSKRNSKDPGYYGKGFYFYPMPSNLGLENPIIKGYFLNVKNPLYLRSGDYIRKNTTGMNLPAGKDGSIIRYYDTDSINITDNIDQLTALNPNQIKSATDNNGLFSTENNNTRMMLSNDPIYGHFNPYSLKKKGAIVLRDKTSENFSTYLQKSRGYYPKKFYDAERNVFYIKSNNRKNSKRYDVVNPETGEIYAQGLPLYQEIEYERLIEKNKKINTQLDPKWKPSDKHSFAFRKFLTTPSKGLFKFAAKQYLKEALNSDDELKFNYSKTIDLFVDSFSENFWEYVMTSTLGLSALGKMFGLEKLLGVTTTDENFLENFIFPQNISKKSLIYKLELELGIKLRRKENFGVIFDESTPYNELIKLLRNWYNYRYKNTSIEESISMYAESHGYTVEEVKNFLERHKNDESMLAIKVKHYIENFSKFDYALSKIKKEYSEKYAKYILEHTGLNEKTIRKIFIVFNRDSSSQIMNRLAAILHEPYHALAMLHDTTIINNELNSFIETSIGKDLYESVKNKLQEIGYNDDIDEEFLANLFAYFMTPEELRVEYLDNSNSPMSIIAKKLIDLEKMPNFKKIIKIENEIEFTKLIEHYSEEEKVTLTFFLKIQNIIARFLRNLCSGLSIVVREIPETRIIERTREVEVPVTKLVTKEILLDDLNVINAKNALEDIFSEMYAIMKAPVTRDDNILSKLESTREMMIGEKGARSLDTAEEATTRMDNLSIANEMEKMGKDALTIKVATGWERGADDKWRYETEDFEIDDAYLQLLLSKNQENISFILSDIINDESLFNWLDLQDAYPTLENLEIEFRNDIDDNTNAYVIPGVNKIFINRNSFSTKNNDGKIILSNLNKLNQTILHEIQHVIQKQEGFARGGNEKLAAQTSVAKKEREPYERYERDMSNIGKEIKQLYDKEKLKIDLDNSLSIKEKKRRKRELYKQIEKEMFPKMKEKVIKAAEEAGILTKYGKLKAVPDDYSFYYRLAGEVEARAVANRNILSLEEKRNTLFTENMYEDVAKEDLIFLNYALGEQKFIGKKSREKFTQTLRKYRPDMSNDEMMSMDKVSSLSVERPNFSSKRTKMFMTISSDLIQPTQNNIPFKSSNTTDLENTNSFLYLNQIIDKLQDLYGINIIHISNAELNLSKWKNVVGIHQAKAFIYNGDIYINTDIATIDSPIHEMLHILFGSMKYLNRELYEQLISSAELFNLDTIEMYPNRTREDINEEAFITELAKYLTGLPNAISNLDLKSLYEISYNVSRTLDSILMGKVSVKCIPQSQLYLMDLKTIARLVNSASMESDFHGSLNDAMLNRILANKKSELMKKGILREECS